MRHATSAPRRRLGPGRLGRRRPRDRRRPGPRLAPGVRRPAARRGARRARRRPVRGRLADLADQAAGRPQPRAGRPGAQHRSRLRGHRPDARPRRRPGRGRRDLRADRRPRRDPARARLPAGPGLRGHAARGPVHDRPGLAEQRPTTYGGRSSPTPAGPPTGHTGSSTCTATARSGSSRSACTPTSRRLTHAVGPAGVWKTTDSGNQTEARFV